MLTLTNRHKRNIKKIVTLSFIWLLAGALYVILEQGLLGDLNYYPSTGNYYDFYSFIIIVPITSFITGLIQNSIEVLYLSKRFLHASFVRKTIAKSIIYLISIVFFLIVMTLISNSIVLGVGVFSDEVINSVQTFFFNFAFLSIMIYIASVITITLFITEISDNIGQGVFVNFITGKYHQAREEERIFMFLDMKSSTSIAEKLGHVRYYQLLNQYYRDLTDAILDTDGEIYQYVGDEVIISWELDNGILNNNCVNCFFKIKEIFKKKYNSYQSEYGLVPEFKAGIHLGAVTTGEVGVLKKEIVFTGDVLNTTARIQGLCNQYHVDLLISADLIEQLNLNSTLEIKEIGKSQLRGREQEIKLITLSQITN